MKRIAITGYKGNIGKILTKALKNKYSLVLLDLPNDNILNYQKTKQKLSSCDTIIHLAWNCFTENVSNHKKDPKNLQMSFNIYKLAKELKIKRVIMASSVHVHDIETIRKNNKKITNTTKTNPISPYGKDKVFLENEGRKYAKFFEVICIRYGGVAPKKSPWGDCYFVGLTHPDLVSLIKKCINTRTLPKKFITLFGVSKNKYRIHDLENPLNWKPKDDAIEFYNINL